MVKQQRGKHTAIWGGFLGASVPPAVFQDELLSGENWVGYVLFIYLSLPAILNISTVFSNDILKKRHILNDLFASGWQIGASFIALLVLLEWYKNPDVGYFEPLFILIGLAIAAIEYCRRYVEVVEKE